MGIPKFFRWISERYPLCSQLVIPNEIPEFDNFYLDMNGIIHNCYRPTDNNSPQLTEVQIFLRIFAYVDDLFLRIKPKKIFFLAVDGVAPRAKMNQQRSRRFRSAREKQLDAKWQDSDFDSNCITPGTVFMHRLDEHLKYFLSKKISEDPQWQHVSVIYSGHDVPGEGEHKIMEYIRLSKAQPDYNPNVRHCLYGLDADLIMLGLVTHDPHFCLLREEVLFGSKKVQKSTTNFHLLHLCLLREYIDLEFKGYFSSTEYSLERVLDDFILFSVLVGNDFLPSLSFIHIHEGAYEILLQTYFSCIKQTHCYLNEFGKINFNALLTFLQLLEKTEIETARKKSKVISFSEKNSLEAIRDFISTSSNTASHEIAFDTDFAFIRNICKKCHIPYEYREGDLWISTIEDEKYKNESLKIIDLYLSDSIDENEFIQDWCSEYYLDKIGNNSVGVVQEMCKNYLEGLQWIMLYYFEGVPSWSWYYMSHYAPKITDLCKYLQQVQIDDIEFSIGTPFKPFEQLMAVLPEFSHRLLPDVLSELMRSPSSPIIHFYPLNFKTDLNGKLQEWEAVVLIPFIEEELLLRTIHSKEAFLNSEEKHRNRFGNSWIFSYSEIAESQWHPSIRFDILHFPSIKKPRVNCLIYNLPVLSLSQSFVKGLCNGVRLGIRAIPGFPTLHTLQFTSKIAPIKVKVFSFPSNFPSLLLSLSSNSELYSDDYLSKMIGRTLYYKWPFLRLCKIESICDGVFIWDKDGKHEINNLTQFEATIDKLYQSYYSSSAVDIGSTSYLVTLSPFLSIKELPDGSKIRIFSTETIQQPLQLLVQELYEEDYRFVEGGPRSLSELIPLASRCIYVGPIKKYVGSLMTITGLKENSVDALIRFVPNQFSFKREILSILQQNEGKYYALYQAASMLECSCAFLALFSSPFYLDMNNNQRINIGIVLKNDSQRLRVPGYVRKQSNVWSFSMKAITLFKHFLQKFPEEIRIIEERLRKSLSVRNISDVFPDIDNLEIKRQRISSMKRWITENTTSLPPMIPLDGEILPLEAMNKCIPLLDEYIAANPPLETFVTNVECQFLIRENQQCPMLALHKFSLGDRCTVIRQVGSIPMGMTATIVGLPGDEKLSILTDYECQGLFEKNESSIPNRLFTLSKETLLNTTYIQIVHKEEKRIAIKAMEVVKNTEVKSNIKETMISDLNNQLTDILIRKEKLSKNDVSVKKNSSFKNVALSNSSDRSNKSIQVKESSPRTNTSVAIGDKLNNVNAALKINHKPVKSIESNNNLFSKASESNNNLLSKANESNNNLLSKANESVKTELDSSDSVYSSARESFSSFESSESFQPKLSLSKINRNQPTESKQSELSLKEKLLAQLKLSSSHKQLNSVDDFTADLGNSRSSQSHKKISQMSSSVTDFFQMADESASQQSKQNEYTFFTPDQFV